MIPTTPIEIDGQQYDHYTASLSLMVRHLPGGVVRTSVNVNLVPTRIDPETGEVTTRQDRAIPLRVGDAANSSPDVVAAVEAILAAGQSFIEGMGL